MKTTYTLPAALTLAVFFIPLIFQSKESGKLKTGSAEKLTAQSLILTLKALHRANPGLNGNLTIDGESVSIKASDAIWLLDLVHDDTPCVRANNVVSSASLPGPSTVGNEAKRLILGYTSGAYPPTNPKPLNIPILRELLIKKINSEIEGKLKKQNKTKVPGTENETDALKTEQE